ncbi:P-loop containing nucleoside triphosphate hydrolase protein [Canariomyces notabilis]|uniref:P-loop containing nucleoside triphosphate hydrolase protein n=1 Tax=Canariomyces notabilis TaxID=2074819 RepID=A0AAN6QH27_9PEZI|nr:P-loop containing nucleoside triphosphate hydrolase protein [Canariomyces arenarius]
METQTDDAAAQLEVVLDAKPRRDKVMIALLGVTGAGKSTFINTATGQDVVKTSSGSKPCTQDPKAIEFRLDDRTVVLIDTPGFDDSKRSDVRILEDIATWMAKGGFLKERMLDGLIFLHPITLARAGGSELNRTKLLEKILGPDVYNRVLIATTMWDYVASEDLVNERLETRFAPGGVSHELKKQGASYVRHENTQKSAHDIIRCIIDITDKFGKPKTLLEDELPKQQGRVVHTTAGKTLEARLQDEIKVLQKQILKHLDKRPPGSYKNDGDREHRKEWKHWNRDQQDLKKQLFEKEQELKKLQNIV